MEITSPLLACTALTVIENDTPDKRLTDFYLEKVGGTEEQALLLEEQNLVRQVLVIQGQLKIMDEDLQKKHINKVTTLEGLQSELLALMLDLQDRKEPVQESSESEGTKSEAAAYTSPNVPKPNKSEEVRKLFKRIASKTHPDKTTNVLLHPMFLWAREYNSRNDYEGLLSLWDRINNTKSSFSLLAALMLRLEELRTKVAFAATTLKNLKQSQPYSMYVDYQVPALQDAVSSHYAVILETHSAAMRKEINRLDPSKYRPAQQVKSSIQTIFASMFTSRN